MPENRPPVPAEAEPGGPPRVKRRYTKRTTAEERSASGRAAAHTRWAKVAPGEARAAQLRPARDASRERFYAAADAQGITDPAAREAMARNAEMAEMARLERLRWRAKREREAAAAAAAGEAV